MQLTFVNDMGQSFVVEIDPNMELENVTAMLEVDSGIPQSEQVLVYEGRQLTNPKATMTQLGVADQGMLMVSRRQARSQQQQSQRSAQIGAGARPDEETMRLRILGDPNLMQQIRETQPDLAASINDPARFRQFIQQTNERRYEADLERQREFAKLNDDPFNVEAQRKIEELIRKEAVEENMQHALEYSPESFGRVTMLYIPVEVNGYKLKAFVDSGAQMTIMSPDCAEKCNIMRLVDNRFAGIARGAGEAKILGKVHSAQLKLADLFLPCSFSVMESRDVDLLFGLDMLKAHQACIDLEKNVLRIQGREVRFLSEHELPVQAFGDGVEADTRSHASTSNLPARPETQGVAATSAPISSPSASRHPQDHIKILMDLGADRETAISTLDAAGGNIDVAASLLF